MELAELAKILTGESSSRIISKYSCTVILTENFAIKTRPLKDSAALSTASEEATWLAASGLDISLHEVDNFVAIIMPRMPDTDCMGWKLSCSVVDEKSISTVISRLASLPTLGDPKELSRHELARQLIINAERQISLAALTDFGHEAVNLVRIGVQPWLGDERKCKLAAHRNAFSPNIFLHEDQTVYILDPRASNDSFSQLPWFGDVATFSVDLMLHGWTPARICNFAFNSDARETWNIFRCIMMVKLMVRYRFAQYEIFSRNEEWRRRQNALVLSRAAILAKDIAAIGD